MARGASLLVFCPGFRRQEVHSSHQPENERRPLVKCKTLGPARNRTRTARVGFGFNHDDGAPEPKAHCTAQTLAFNGKLPVI
jgi:hypothetical protein